MLNVRTLLIPPLVVRLIQYWAKAAPLPTGLEIATKYASDWQLPTPSNGGGVGAGYLYSLVDEVEPAGSYFDYSLRNIKGE